MFVLTVFVYPAVLTLLCVGAGLLVDRCSGGALHAALLVPVGAAALIAVSQLTTYFAALAPATPVVMAVVAAAGLALAWRNGSRRSGRGGARGGHGSWWRSEEARWAGGVSVLVYALALAPVLLSGRTTFSSFMALSDSAVHLLGADYLLRHGQSYSHLDLANSYGQFVEDYYGSGYPSGADTLFGGSAFALGLPLIWAFQPFVAFMLAVAAGPAWLLVRRTGLAGAWAALATLCVCAPALVYAYELIGSVKEIAALPMIITLGALATVHRGWLRGPAVAVVPFALVTAAGVSTLGVGFGVWALAAGVVAAVALLGDSRSRTAPAGGPRVPAGARRSQTLTGAVALVATGAIVALVCAWPTWVNLSGSVSVTQNIAGTSNPGNLSHALRAVQALGVWLHGSYKLAPSGGAGAVTHALIVISLIACVWGLVRLVATRELALAGWLLLMIAVWLAVSASSTTWVSAKTLMLTSPAVVLMAWAGVAALRASPLRRAAPLVALALVGGVLGSDALQYHSSDLAPTARYDELGSLNARFAGRGPTLFTDFDEYSMYQLRDLDVGGPDFVYPPPALAAIAGGYGRPVDLDRAPPAALRSYPLIITRRDPAASRPPSAYRLAWQGTYYQVWARRAGAQTPVAHVALEGGAGAQCAQIARLAGASGARDAQLVAASAPAVVDVAVAHASHPRGWGRERRGLVLSGPGTLSARFTLPHGGVWSLWLQGRLMPAVSVGVDGHGLGSISGQLSGNSLIPDTITPLTVQLTPGVHRLTVTRGRLTLAPGDGGTAVLDDVLVAAAGAAPSLRTVADARWRSLCGGVYQWVELVRA